mmetsp:Transcript_32322/g.58672  ORF Transcript_32322/g.58672 Transcript_32322/m.58672 type:complete len:539 (+) Transcript_32322:70-1686(+)|eukprot:CAMPEP_0197621608 /NCGR_PEP_ID=MMETSP1338-20131121/2141_1 /TAXON_ID=43686 ORGANISM="Pelagodinium beii, Strain RCC1491" /NCGR_SAMPLE_ID=MMETSP1338 /ASSEMBLY_ACC=CAM_ASM_000754 /LENGTH=538 /DNA_ID=CAMNT_0043191119 /DNA_START=49 /DNA_END=1665 /DNA_ORIENTATION=-
MAPEMVKVKAGTCPMSCMEQLVPTTRAKATAASAVAGSIAGGTTGGAAGLMMGAAAGIVPAVFTFGLSIPIGAAVGTVAGTTTGGSLGAICGSAMGYLGFTYKKEILATAKKAGEGATDAKEFVVYMVDVNMWKLRGEQFYSARYQTKDGGRCPVIQAFGGNVFCRADEVVPRLKDLDPALMRGDAVRHNWLGPTKLASGVMADGVFGLGVSPSDHLQVRAFLDETLWGNSKKWSENQVQQEAKAFVEKHRVLEMPSAGKEFTITCLARHWLGLRVPEELDPKKFLKFQTIRFLLSMLPNLSLKLPGMKSMAGWVQVEMEDYMEMISSSLKRNYPEVTQGKNIRVLAAGALDALTYAGGLSVGEITARVMASLWNKHGALGAEDFKLTRQNIDEVIYETMRLFPAVSNISYERQKPFGVGAGAEVTGREILAIGPVMREQKVWGSDAEEFKLRGDAYKSASYCPFGNGATHRACPGADVAMSLVRELVLEINAHEWQMQRQWIHTLPLPSPVPVPFGIGLSKVWFFGYSNEDFTVEIM